MTLSQALVAILGIPFAASLVAVCVAEIRAAYREAFPLKAPCYSAPRGSTSNVTKT